MKRVGVTPLLQINGFKLTMNYQDLLAIDIHTHAEVSCWNPCDAYGEEYDRAAENYFCSSNRPTITETIAHYREKKIGLIMFTVDSESNQGRKRIPYEEIPAAAKETSDMMMAFASIDPHKGNMGAPEAEGLVKEHNVKGFKFHPNDKRAWACIAAASCDLNTQNRCIWMMSR